MKKELQSKDLRIGNALEWNYYEVVVTDLSEDKISCIGDRVYPDESEDLKPIELTKSNLKRLGFDVYGVNDSWYTDGWIFIEFTTFNRFHCLFKTI